MSDFEFKIKITGEKELLRNIERLGLGLIREAQSAGEDVGNELLLEPSRARAPKKTGRLRRSGRLMVRKYKDATIVKVIYGGELAPWARFVHENLEARFKEGEAKFLERTFNEARGRFTPALGERISLARAVRG